MFEARIDPAAFDEGSERARLLAAAPGAGAVVSFTGLVRDVPLFLEHWPAVAERRLAALVEAARQRWPLHGAIVIHRHGALDPGAPIVLVLVAARHRAEAFAAAQYLIDALKTDAPFWKKEPDGWVEARASDGEARSRWEDA